MYFIQSKALNTFTLSKKITLLFAYLVLIFIVGNVNAKDISLGNPTNQGHGQKKYSIDAGKANANKDIEYTEENPDGQGGTRKETKRAKLDKDGKLELWVSTATDLKNACTVKPKPKKQADLGFSSPGGITVLSFSLIEVAGIFDRTLSFDPIIIDSNFFPLGPGGSDTLLGAEIKVTALDDYIGLDQENQDGFGSIFDTFAEVFPGVPGAAIEIKKDNNTLLTAQFDALINEPGEVSFSAILNNIEIFNIIGSNMLDDLNIANGLGRTIAFDVLPTENIALATQSFSGTELASYTKNAQVGARAGLSVLSVPEPATVFSYIFALLLMHQIKLKKQIHYLRCF